METGIVYGISTNSPVDTGRGCLVLSMLVLRVHMAICHIDKGDS